MALRRSETLYQSAFKSFLLGFRGDMLRAKFYSVEALVIPTSIQNRKNDDANIFIHSLHPCLSVRAVLQGSGRLHALGVLVKFDGTYHRVNLR